MRLPIRTSLLLGTIIGLHGMIGTYLAVTFLPMPLQILVPILLLVIPLVVQWPRLFDQPADDWATRLTRRLALVAGAAVIAAAVAWIAHSAVPGYSVWADNLHRESQTRAGKSPDEVEAFVAQHHQTASGYAFEGAMITVIPGALAALVTLGVGAIVFRRRPARP